MGSAVHPVVARFAATCQADDRVLAAFLGGSHAAGTADAHSDLDFYAVVADDAYDGFLADAAAFVGELGEPLFLEHFDDYGFDLFLFVLADGTEGELGLGRASGFTHVHGGPHAVLVDKAGLLDGVTFPLRRPDPAEQRELLRRQIALFWHDLGHLAKALARGQLWAAQGNLADLRLVCVQLARLRHDFAALADGYERLDRALPPEAVAPLAASFAPLDRAAMVAAAHVVVDYYRALVPALAAAHGLAYPTKLDRIVSARLPSV